MKLIQSDMKFNNIEHEKAWLIRTASNICKNRLKHWSRKNLDLEDYVDYSDPSDTPDKNVENNEILEAVRGLPEKLRTVVYLYYYEGYTSIEIAKTLGKADSTVRKHLKEARNLLKHLLEGYNL